MLECRNVSVFYGPHRAVDGVSIDVAAGEIVAILGANGAGKSSLLNAIAGMVDMEDDSEITMDGQTIAGWDSHRIIDLGLSMVPEGRGLFGELTVLENLTLGAYPKRARSDQAQNLERVLSLFPKLAERRSQSARTMSGGEQQMVAMARALMSSPTILMLDEPSLGLSPLLCTELFRALEQVRQTGVGILLVEQNAKQSLAIADRGYLLETGRIVGADRAEVLAGDAAVVRAYLGAGTVVVTAERRRPRTDDIIKEGINDLVARAAQRQDEHINHLRSQNPAAGKP